jgi:hypothetical protein
VTFLLQGLGGGWRKGLFAISVLLATDLLAARLLVWVQPDVDVPRSERVRLEQLDRERTERLYRVPSTVYDHDLAKLFDGTAGWGPLRYRIRTNSLGFKDGAARVVPLQAARQRVLLIGDSFTEGLGFDYEHTYAGRIAKQLDAGGVDLLNAAVTSYSPAIYYSKVRYLLEHVGLQFTELIVFIDISDIEDEARYYQLDANGRVTRRDSPATTVADSHEMDSQRPDTDLVPTTLPSVRRLRERGDVRPDARTNHEEAADRTPPTPETTPGPLERFVARAKRYSTLLRVPGLIDDWRHHGRASVEPRGYPQANPRRSLWTVDESDFQAFGRVGLALAGRHMDLLATLLRTHGIGLTVAVYPWPDQIRYGGADSLQVTYWQHWAARRGVRFIDLFAPFFGDADRDSTIETYFIQGDVHFNSRGHERMASAFMSAYRPPRPPA